MGKVYSIGPITGVYLKPRYAMINGQLGEDFNPGNGLDIFLDLNTLVHALATAPKYLNSLPFADNIEADLIASILGVLKHWKDFARKWENSRIFLMATEFDIAGMPEQDISKSYFSPFVHKFGQERFSIFTYNWTEAMKKIAVVLKYVPLSYMIRCNRFDSYVVPNIVDDYKSNGRYRIIVSDSPLMTTYGLEPNTKVMYARFRNMISDPEMIVKSISKIDADVMTTFIQNKVFYALLNAVIGDFDRGLIGISDLGISTFANDLLRAVERNEIPKDPKSIESVLPIIKDRLHDYLRNAYKLINIDEHTMLIPRSMVERIKSTMVDEYDIDGLSKLSVEDFNLIELL